MLLDLQDDLLALTLGFLDLGSLRQARAASRALSIHSRATIRSAKWRAMAPNLNALRSAMWHEGSYSSRQLEGHPALEEVLCLAAATTSRACSASARCATLASGSRHDTARLWELGTDQQSARMFARRGSVHCVALVGGALATGSGASGQAAVVRRTDAGEWRDVAIPVLRQGSRVTGLAWLTSGVLLTVSLDGTLRQIEWPFGLGMNRCGVKTFRNAHLLAPRAITALAHDFYFVSGGDDGAVMMWDRHLARTSTFEHGDDPVCSLANGGHDNTFASGHAACTKLWDPRARGRPTGIIDSGPRGAAALAASGELLFSAGADTYVRVWDLRAQRVLARLGGHLSQVGAVAAADGAVFSGDSAGKVRMHTTSDLSAHYP